ncbi:TRAP transporter fused permease subunit [Enterocloster bolteae]|uniref:TRAP transporter permease n=1 Tax=Enterocloster bolteae TaxID=208479 RepID=UPI0028DC5A2B|nr:TRAP transporter fused permease subunit [Enterocloster bolteae]
MGKEKKESSSDLVMETFAGGSSKEKESYQTVYLGLAAVLTAIMLYYYTVGGVGEMEIRGIFLMLVMAMCFFPKSAEPLWKQGTDCVLMALGSASNIYMMVNNYSMKIKYAGLDVIDIVMGLMLVILILEATRRKVGLAMPLIALVFVAYAFFGSMIPGKYGAARLTVSQVVSMFYAGTEGIYGSALSTMVSTVFLFVLMGGLMESTGAGQFFIDISKAICGKSPGGTAKIAVICSMLFGSISGSAVANTVTTGSFTIPMMKESGYSSPFASAITAVASTGGQMMPPVMGAGAFLIAELTGTAYSKVVLVSIIPAVLFYCALYLEADLQAKKQGMKGLPAEQIPNAKKVLKEQGAAALPLLLLLILIIFSGMTVVYAGVFAVGALVVLGVLRGKGKQRYMFIFDGIKAAAPSIASTAICCGCAGLVIGSVTITGLSYTFSSMLMNLAAGNIFIALLLVMVLGFILGMGLPTTPAFIIMIAVTGTGLVNMGLPILTAYMIIFWFAQSANITPPVCMAAYAAAGISGSKPMEIGIQAVKFGFPMFIIPFLMAYRNILFDGGSVVGAIIGCVTGALGVVCITVLIIGYCKTELNIMEKTVIAVAGLSFFYWSTAADVIGIAALAAFMVLHFCRANKRVLAD